MFSFAFITGLAFLSTTGWAQYVLEDDYTSNGNFFDQFNFFNDSDPTHGFVDYVDKDYAWNAGLIGNDYGKVYMGVDHTGIASKHGRPAVRIESTKTYDSGLVIIDVEHMPGGICGTWPAFWMVGPDWPDNGEIDILEGVNDQTCNDMTLHTGPGCSISRHTDMLASVSTDNCDVKAEGQSDNQGCQIKTDDPRSYGKGFNDNGGGVYATEIMESFINIFFFPRGSIPSDISSSSPDPSSWGKPTAVFMGDCDIAQTFKKMQLVFTNTFCGDWAGNTWDQSSCASKADSCDDYVQNNPEAFEDAYWSVNSLRVYKHGKPYVSSTATTSERTSSKMSHTAPVPYSSEASNSSMTSLVYSTKGTGIPMPSGVPEYGPYGGIYGNSGKGASPTAAAEASQGYGLVPSHLLPTNVRVAATGTAAAVAAEMSTQARQRPEGWQWRGSSRHRHHGSEKTARHLRQHKRHGGRGH